MSMNPDILTQLNVDLFTQINSNLIRPVYFGVVSATLLFGITCAQAYRYICRHNDTRLDKLFVLGLWLLDTLHLSTSLYIGHAQLVSAWNNPFSLVDPVIFRVVQVHLSLDAIMISCTYTLYGRLAWKLSCNVHWFCTYFMILMILLIYGASIFAVSEVRRIQPSLEFFFNFTGTFGPTLYIFFSLAAFAEVVFGIFVCYLLRHSRREFFNPQAMVATSLSNYAVASGLLASALQVAIVLTCALLPGNFAFFAIQMILPSVLGNSYLALMNARHVFRHGIRCKDAPNLPFNDSSVTVHVSASTTFSQSSKLQRALRNAQPIFRREVDPRSHASFFIE